MNAPSVMELRNAAVDYANRGYYVFPCVERGKSPAIKHGFKDATRDIAKIEEWWSEKPYNIGIAPGRSNIVVLDVDIDHDAGKYGDETLQELEAKNTTLPDTVEVLTGGGGRHLYFMCDDPKLTAGVRFAPNLDYRGTGGYVIAPPSVHPTGRRYEWEAAHNLQDTEIAPLAEWLHQMMLSGTNAAKKATKMAPTHIGTGERNDTLFREACSLRSKGYDTNALQAAVVMRL